MGDEAVLTVRISSGENSEERRLTVASEMLFKIGNIGAGSLPYPLTAEQFDTLEYDAGLWEAVKKGLDILSYGDNTESALTSKLRVRGFDRYIAEDAAQYLSEHGYIDERRILERAVEQLGSVKLYGRSRIKSELYKKGISRDVIDEYLEEYLDLVDTEANLIKLVKRKCDLDSIGDRKYREKFYAAMYRLGYSPSEVRDAIREVMDEETE